jgi:hypothetical protein
MPFFDGTYDPEVLDIMTRAFDGAWSDAQASNAAGFGLWGVPVRRAIALRILAAVRVGERDPERLRQLALDMVQDLEPG